MVTNNIYLENFKTDHDFYPDINLLITIKSFDLQAIRKRYIESKKNKSNRSGSVARREVTIGGVAFISIRKGEIKNCEVLAKLKEPRGIDYANGVYAISSENKVYVLSDKVYKIIDPWFSYIHTVNLHPTHNNRILISSSGYDSIFEYDYIKNEKTYEWFAWENGFNYGIDPETGERNYLTRNIHVAEEYKNKNIKHTFISDPLTQVLPTAKRAAFINSVLYDQLEPDKIIATFFHEGALFEINKASNTVSKILGGLKNPHGGRRFGNSFLATSTGDGRVVVQGIERDEIHFKNLPGKPQYLEEMEWLQNSAFINNNLITIDSNRNCFVITNLVEKKIDFVNYDINYAVQDLVLVDMPINNEIKKLSEL